MVVAESAHWVGLAEAQRAASSTAKCRLPIANSISDTVGMPTISMMTTGATMANSTAVVP